MNSDLINLFEELGGEFVSPPVQLMQKWSKIKAFVFDWDGVFNTGLKGHETTSHFTEADSMGVNMLRFSYWLTNNYTQPVTAIITGQNNVSAEHFANREHFNFIFSGCPDKQSAYEQFLESAGINHDEVMYVIDDVLDLTIADKCGLRIMINRYASPLFYNHVKTKKLADYISFNVGGENAVREVCELLIGLNGNYTTVMEKRMVFEGDYKTYLDERNKAILEKINCK
jgi:3-deoxy-D-manno-octulosonate 8-phosphate phosphatase (KDO 8-P phosphatase)